MVQFHELVPEIPVLEEPLNKERSRVAEICLQLEVELLDELPGFLVGPAEREAGDFKDSRACAAILRETRRGRLARAQEGRSPTASTCKRSEEHTSELQSL